MMHKQHRQEQQIKAYEVGHIIRTILSCSIFSLMVFVGYNQPYDIDSSAASSETQSDSSAGNDAASNQSASDILNQLADLDFFIAAENLSDADDETITKFGKSFVNLFNGAVAKQEKVSFKKYISNERLLEFTDKFLELTQRQQRQGKTAVIYGLENEFNRSELQHMGDNFCHLELQFEFKGSGTGCKMLITAENKALKLVDLYFGSKDGADTFATGHPAARVTDDPNLWKNRAWTESVFDKLKDFEEMLGP
jgi:hypothetical protein